MTEKELLERLHSNKKWAIHCESVSSAREISSILNKIYIETRVINYYNINTSCVPSWDMRFFGKNRFCNGKCDTFGCDGVLDNISWYKRKKYNIIYFSGIKKTSKFMKKCGK